ncbi:MAG TPA: glycosyltransferase [Ktedonobacteraceae bacterium]
MMALSVVQVIGNSVIGGAESHLLDLVQGSGKLGVDVEVICPRPGPLTQQLEARGVPVQCIEMVHPWPNDEYALDRKAVRELVMVLEKKRPDVVHSHLYPAHLHASLAAQEVGIPAIVHTAHTIIVRPGDALLSYVTAAHTIAVSRAAAHLLENAGVPPERLEVIYNGVAPQHFVDDPEAMRRTRAALNLGCGPVIGIVSRLSREKGIDIFLRAMQQVVRVAPQVKVLVVGDGPQAAELHLLTDELGLSETIRFLGARRDIPVLNRLLDLFVLPSREEACPMALLEAMAAGRSVVATDVGGTPEVVMHTVDGWLVPPDDPLALSQALLMLLEDPARRATMGAAARQKVAARFTRDRMVQETLSFYQRILASSFSTRQL